MDETVYSFPKTYSGSPQEQIISRLAALQEGHKYSILRLEKINGSINDLYDRTEENEKEIIRHAGQCVLHGRVEEVSTLLATTKNDSTRIATLNEEIYGLNKKITELDKTIAEQLAEKKEAARWHRMLQPLILGFGAAILSTILTLMMLHSSYFVKSTLPPLIREKQNAVLIK
jgi:cell division protein FtsL